MKPRSVTPKSRRMMVVWALVVSTAPGVASAAPEVVAVFAIQDSTSSFTPAEIEQLSGYLAAKIAEGERYTIVPRSEMTAAIRRTQKETYDSCYDESCQIDIGRELAAQKALQTQLIKLGTKCAVTATLYDLTTAASERSTTAKSVCDVDSLVAALEEVARTLTALRRRPPEPVAVDRGRPAVERKPKPAPARLTVLSKPAGAKVRVGNQGFGRTPVSIELRAGEHEVALALDGHLPQTKSLAPITAGSKSQIEFVLRETPARKRERANLTTALTAYDASLVAHEEAHGLDGTLAWTGLIGGLAAAGGSAALYHLSASSQKAYDGSVLSSEVGGHHTKAMGFEIGAHSLAGLAVAGVVYAIVEWAGIPSRPEAPAIPSWYEGGAP